MKALVNCVELLPIFDFDEFEHSKKDDRTGRWQKLNYWGYTTVGFFAPKAGYAATGRTGDGTMVVDELKTLVKELHKNGIEVILDVVFNHTAEGNELGPSISFRGIDNVTYYMITPEGYYYNFTGTGNTLNCNNPIVRDMVLDALRYWGAEFHIDGFRFDLAAILGRDPWGAPMANPPLLEALAYDPILGKCKLIAEAWDAGGLYQVGSFPAYGRWAEWNGYLAIQPQLDSQGGVWLTIGNRTRVPVRDVSVVVGVVDASGRTVYGPERVATGASVVPGGQAVNLRTSRGPFNTAEVLRYVKWKVEGARPAQ